MGEWKPGDVGVTSHGRLALRRENHPDGWIDSHGAPWSSGKFPANVRPLVVIDPEDAEQVDALTKAIVEACSRDGNVIVSDNGIHPDTTQRALREFARPTPSIEEPQGLGAVVEDAQGQRWVRLNPSGLCQWLMEDAGALGKLHDGHRGWDSLHAVRILAPGVES